MSDSLCARGRTPAGYLVSALCLLLATTAPGQGADQQPAVPRLRVLFLGGSSGSHQTRSMFELARPALVRESIELEYREDFVAALTAKSLERFDVVAIYKDDGELPVEAEQSLVRYIEAGHGLVAVHCASHAFRNSDAYTQLIGGRFLKHGQETFNTTIIDAQHPAVSGVRGFETRDETYVHNALASDIRVLMVRAEDGGYEPYTWVRSQQRGRIYYTALGHDEATWRSPAFRRQLVQAIRWTAAAAQNEAPSAPGSSEAEGVKDYTREALAAAPPPPLAPEESMRRMHLPEGFGVRLFAAEPQIVKPLSMTFDARGRLWVIESVDYPNDVLEPLAGNDRIKICADTDGDQVADKFTVFAEGLNIPTSLLPYRDGVLVALAPHILFLRDTDGDDVCDEKKVLFSGFGRFDTHAVHSNFRWGLDNWVWGTVGYSGGDLDVAGKRHRFKQGVFRFRPDGSRFEFLTSTSNNTWGLGFRESGEVFVSTANNQHAVHLAIPNRYYEAVRGWHGQGSAGIEDHKRFHSIGEVRQVDWHVGYTAAAGATVYAARQFPEEYADRAMLVCEPTGHLVHIDWLVPRGSGYAARDGWNLLASDDPWCAPIETHVGPDGAVWMIDWYNYIVRHNPTPPGFETGRGNAYVTPQRDKRHGRIYRIAYERDGAASEPALGRPTLADRDSDGLIAALADPNYWRRITAQRLLLERGDSALVGKIRATLPTAAPRAIPHLLSLLGELKAVETEPALRRQIVDLLRHAAPAVRRAALAALPRDNQASKEVLAAGVLDDTDFGIRLAALLALAEMPGSKEVAAAIRPLAEDEQLAADRWLRDGMITAAAPSSGDFLAEFQSTQAIDTQSSQAVRDAQVALVRAIAEHWSRGSAHDALERIVAGLVTCDPAIAAAALAGLAAGWPTETTTELSDQGKQSIEQLFARLPPEGQLQLVELARRWNAAESLQARLEKIEQELLAQARDEQSTDDVRLQAAARLAALSGREAILKQLGELISPRASIRLNEGVLEAFAQSPAPQVAGTVLSAWERMTPTVRRQAISTLMRRPIWTEELLDSIAAGAVARDDLALDQVQQLLNHPQQKIAALAKKALGREGALPTSNRAQVLAELLPLADQPGDPQLGRKVFEQNCAKCHRHGAVGDTIGPDLTGIAARNRAEILTDVLDPNRSVEGNYRQFTVSTTGGEVFTGLLLAETQTAFELLDSQAKKHVVLRGDVDEFVPSPLSVMPEGFEKLPAAELSGLIEFLAARGKYLPLSLAKAATIVSTRGMFYDRGSEVERLIVPSWGPVTAEGVPFQLIDPRGDQVPNVVLLHGPIGAVCQSMPKSVSIPCGLAARQIHFLSGVSGWGFPGGRKHSVTMIVRLHYEGGASEDHSLQNGVHFADYIRRVDVPESRFAFAMRDQQMRYLTITPRQSAVISAIELIKGSDQTAPVVLAVTLERPME